MRNECGVSLRESRSQVLPVAQDRAASRTIHFNGFRYSGELTELGAA